MVDIYDETLKRSSQICELMRRINVLETLESVVFDRDACSDGSFIYTLGRTTALDINGTQGDAGIDKYSLDTGRLIERDFIVVTHNVNNLDPAVFLEAPQDFFFKITANPSGDIFIGGVPTFDADSPMIIKYDSDGELVKEKRQIVPPPPFGVGIPNTSFDSMFEWNGGFIYLGGNPFLRVPDDLEFDLIDGMRTTALATITRAALLENDDGDDLIQGIDLLTDPDTYYHASWFTQGVLLTNWGYTAYGVNSGKNVVVQMPHSAEPPLASKKIGLANLSLDGIGTPTESNRVNPLLDYPLTSDINTDEYTLSGVMSDAQAFYLYDNKGGLIKKLVRPTIPGELIDYEDSVILRIFDVPTKSEFILYGIIRIKLSGDNANSTMVRYDYNGDFIDYLPPLTSFSLTEWFGYPDTTSSISIGTNPANDALNTVESITATKLIIQMRTALTALLFNFKNPVTGAAYNTIDGSADNLYNVAMTDRVEYDYPSGTQYYDYAFTEAQMDERTPFTIDIGEIQEQIIVLEASSPA